MGRKQWQHRANRGRLVESDFDRKARAQSHIGSGYSSAQYQTILTPKGKFPQRKPDLTIQLCGYTVPLELDGGVHGFNDELTETEKTKTRNDDYVREGYIPIILNHEQLAVLKIPEEIFIKCAIILLEPIFRTKRRLNIA